MSDLIVAEQLQQFLVAEGIGQLPATAPSDTLPSIWLKPREGAPLPRMDGATWLEDTTVTITDTQLSPRPNLEPWIEEAYIDILVRARQDAAAQLLHRAIGGLLAPVGIVGGRKGWTMHELPILYSTAWRGEQPLPPANGGLTYDRVASYRIACRRSDLAA
ncbi:MAG: hypothetical protein ACRDK4_05005 [Solirubrobacteraceae bacterium]